MKSNKEIKNLSIEANPLKDSLKEIFERLNDLSEEVTETKYDYGEWGIKFDTLVNQLKSEILEKLKDNSCLEHGEQLRYCSECISEAEDFTKELTIKQYEQKIKERIEKFEGKFRTEMSDEFKIIFDEVERTSKTNPICEKELHNLFDRCYYQTERTFRENFKELKSLLGEKE
jgi:predicted transcriptional regulator